MKYRCYKYWHSSMLNAISLAVVVDYDMFLEVAEGEINYTWKEDNIVDFWNFYYLLFNQMIK